MKLDFSNSQHHEITIKGPVSYMTFTPSNKTNSMMDLVSSLVIDQIGRMATPPNWIRDGIILGVQGGTDIVLWLLHFPEYLCIIFVLFPEPYNDDITIIVLSEKILLLVKKSRKFHCKSNKCITNIKKCSFLLLWRLSSLDKKKRKKKTLS